MTSVCDENLLDVFTFFQIYGGGFSSQIIKTANPVRHSPDAH